MPISYMSTGIYCVAYTDGQNKNTLNNIVKTVNLERFIKASHIYIITIFRFLYTAYFYFVYMRKPEAYCPCRWS